MKLNTKVLVWDHHSEGYARQLGELLCSPDLRKPDGERFDHYVVGIARTILGAGTKGRGRISKLCQMQPGVGDPFSRIYVRRYQDVAVLRVVVRPSWAVERSDEPLWYELGQTLRGGLWLSSALFLARPVKTVREAFETMFKPGALVDASHSSNVTMIGSGANNTGPAMSALLGFSPSWLAKPRGSVPMIVSALSESLGAFRERMGPVYKRQLDDLENMIGALSNPARIDRMSEDDATTAVLRLISGACLLLRIARNHHVTMVSEPLVRWIRIVASPHYEEKYKAFQKRTERLHDMLPQLVHAFPLKAFPWITPSPDPDLRALSYATPLGILTKLAEHYDSLMTAKMILRIIDPLAEEPMVAPLREIARTGRMMRCILGVPMPVVSVAQESWAWEWDLVDDDDRAAYEETLEGEAPIT